MMLHQIKNTTQQQKLPGVESKMDPAPINEIKSYIGSKKLKHKVAIITGGDSGIGQAVAIAYAKEGAKVVIVYLSEHEDAHNTKNRVEEAGQSALLIPGDVSDIRHCERIVNKTLEAFGRIDILVNHVGEQYQTDDIYDITPQTLERIFRVNVFSIFYLTQKVLPHLKPGSSIINTTSIVAYKGNPLLLDYTATKGAILSFTRALARSLADKGIRVNGVAPGPIWTPLIPASFSKEALKDFGQDTLLKRPGQPFELAPAYVYLASNIDSSYVTGQVIHIDGGGFTSS